jgi:hypothetical protein
LISKERPDKGPFKKRILDMAICPNSPFWTGSIVGEQALIAQQERKNRSVTE